tara:strand:+ start:1091 stop:1468 length:378 start_codon:yes stop_codon:yes gene_type:complete
MDEEERRYVYQPDSRLPDYTLEGVPLHDQTVLQQIHAVFRVPYEGDQPRFNRLSKAIASLPSPYNAAGHQLNDCLTHLWQDGGVLDKAGVSDKQRADVEYTLKEAVNAEAKRVWDAHLQVAGGGF